MGTVKRFYVRHDAGSANPEVLWGGCLLRTRRAIYLVEGRPQERSCPTTTGNPGNVGQNGCAPA
jgi:hypothetical protein